MGNVFANVVVGPLSFDPNVGGYTSDRFESYINVVPPVDIFAQWHILADDSSTPCMAASSPGIKISVMG